MIAKNNIPQLRFTGFVGEWEKSKLNKFASLNPKNSALPESFIYIDLESVTDGLLIKESVISKDEAPSRAQRILIDKDILYQTVRPYQKNNLYFDKVGNYVASTGYAQIRTINDSQFLFQFLHTEKFVANVMLRCTGTSYPAINSSDLSTIEISYPTLPEQQKIASFLSAVDEKIQQLSRKKELLEQYKKGVMQQLFSGKLRFKGHNDKWQKIAFTDCCDLIHGFQFREEHFENSGLPVIKIGSLVDNGSISFHNATYVSKDCETTHSRFILKKGDVLMALTGGTLGKVSRIDNDYGVLFQNYRVGKFENKLNSLKEYIYYLLQSRLVQNRLKSLVNEAAQPNFGKQDFDKIRFELPSVQEQQKIADFLLCIDTKIESTRQQIAQTQSFKKGLLQQLFV